MGNGKTSPRLQPGVERHAYIKTPVHGGCRTRSTVVNDGIGNRGIAIPRLKPGVSLNGSGGTPSPHIGDGAESPVHWLRRLLEERMAIYSETIDVFQSTAIRRLKMDFPTSGPPPDPHGAAGDIHVTMKHGRTYVYAVPSTWYWTRFKSAPSAGRYYVRVIKARFDYYKKY